MGSSAAFAVAAGVPTGFNLALAAASSSTLGFVLVAGFTGTTGSVFGAVIVGFTVAAGVPTGFNLALAAASSSVLGLAIVAGLTGGFGSALEADAAGATVVPPAAGFVPTFGGNLLAIFGGAFAVPFTIGAASVARGVFVENPITEITKTLINIVFLKLFNMGNLLYH